MTQPPICLDLCCGLGGWTEGFLAVGYECHGYDIKDFNYPGTLHLQDIRQTVDIAAMWIGRVDVIVASPPCNEFTIRDLPWGRKKDLPPPDTSIVEACYQLRDLIRPRVFLLENVRGAQPWIGRAPAHRGPYYFWGDVALLPFLPVEFKKGVTFGTYKSNGNKVTQHRHSYKENIWGHHPELRAKIPWPLAQGYAQLCIRNAP